MNRTHLRIWRDRTVNSIGRCGFCARPLPPPRTVSQTRWSHSGSHATSETLRGITRLSQYFLPTFKAESLPATQAALPSFGLLLRAGFVRQSSAGIFTLLPLGLRVVHKIATIIEEEMNAIGASRLEMPTLLSSALWQKSGRWDSMDSELFKLEGRGHAQYLLGPTHEEEVTRLVADEVQSHRQLPVKVYQITRKYRDEPRPRSGLLRTREFYMKDLYTFDKDIESARHSYEQVRGAYARILDRLLGSNHGSWVSAAADTGAIGGHLSHEYHFLDDLGEDVLLSCDACGESANSELAQSEPRRDASLLPMEQDDLRVELYEERKRSAPEAQPTLSPITAAGPASALWAVVVPRDRSASPVHVQKASGRELQPLHSGSACFAPEQFASFFDRVHVLADAECSAVEPTELMNAVAARITSMHAGGQGGHMPTLDDFFPPLLRRSPQAEDLHEPAVELQYGSFRAAANGDRCASCARQGRTGSLVANKAIEVGHTFLLGSKYSDALQVGFAPADGGSRRSPFQMGCYGLGISRLLGAVAKRSASEHGFVWPQSIAPFRVCIIADPSKNGDAVAQVLSALQTAVDNHLELPIALNDVVIDDRTAMSIPKRIKEAELVGFPVTIVVGRAWDQDRQVQIVLRTQPHENSNLLINL